MLQYIDIYIDNPGSRRLKRVLNQRGTTACVSENSGDDERYLNSDHPGWSLSCYPLHQRFSNCGIRRRAAFFYPELDLDANVRAMLFVIVDSIGKEFASLILNDNVDRFLVHFACPQTCIYIYRLE